MYVNVVLVNLKPALETLWQLNYIVYDYNYCISTVITTLNENWAILVVWIIIIIYML